MKPLHTKSGLAALCVLTSALSACGGGSSSAPADGSPTGGAGPATPVQGQVTLSIADSPMDEAAGVMIQFSGVALKHRGDSAEHVHHFDAPRHLNLMEYQEGRSALLLDHVHMPAGEYEWVRLMVDAHPGVHDSFLMHNSGAQCELQIPSGAESGLKLNRPFTLPADGAVALTIDFDLRQSVHHPAGRHGMGMDCSQGYVMRPTLRIVNEANVGAIVGDVDAALVTQSCRPKVYIYAGAGVTPDDVELTGAAPDVDPVIVAPVVTHNGATSYRYHAHFLPPGAYTAAFTCSDDDPGADDVLVFSAPLGASVEANMITTVNFTTP